jgi:hypothetical protein
VNAVAQIGFGEVRHARTRPRPHAFRYPTAFLMLPLRSLRAHGPGALARNRRALFGFQDRDHGDGRDDCLAWLDSVLHQHGIHDARSGCTPTRAPSATPSSRSASGTASAPTARCARCWPRSTTPSASATPT